MSYMPPNPKKLVTAPLKFVKDTYKALEVRAEKKRKESPYEWIRVGGSEPIRVRKDRPKRSSLASDF